MLFRPLVISIFYCVCNFNFTTPYYCRVLHPESTYKDAKELTSDVDGDTDGNQTTSPAVQRTSSKGSDSDWMEPSMQPYDRKLVQSPRWGRVYDAFHLLETEPSVQVIFLLIHV